MPSLYELLVAREELKRTLAHVGRDHSRRIEIHRRIEELQTAIDDHDGPAEPL
jgi:hypothetical protein